MNKRNFEETSEFYKKPFSIAHDELEIYPARDEKVGEIHAGNVVIPTGYHADVIFTLRLEGPCNVVKFSYDSKLVFTASHDCTSKIWSSISGDPLFQINTPSAIRGLALVKRESEMYIVLENRVLILDVLRHSRTASLPEYWEEQLDDQLYDYEDGVFTEKKERAKSRGTPSTYVNSSRSLTASSKSDTPTGKIGMNISDIKKVLAHGTVAPSYLANLVTEFPDIDAAVLFQKMQEFNVKPNALLRMIASAKYHPKDLLSALTSATNGESLFRCMTMGFPLTPVMDSLGFSKLESAQDDQSIIFLHQSDVGPKYKKGVSKLKQAVKQTPFKKMLEEKTKKKQADERSKAVSELSFTGAQQPSKLKSVATNLQKERAKKAIPVKFKPAEQRRLVYGIESLKDTKGTFIQQAFGKAETKYPNMGFEGPREIKTPLVESQKVATTPKPGSRPTNETEFLEKQQEKLRSVSHQDEFIRKSKISQEIAKGKARMTGKHGRKAISTNKLSVPIGKGKKTWNIDGSEVEEGSKEIETPPEDNPKTPNQQRKSIY